MKVKITSTYDKNVILTYRAPGTRALIDVQLPPRALLQEVSFPSKEYYDAFAAQIADLIESKRIIIGDTKGSEAEKIHKEAAKQEQKRAKERAEKTEQQIQGSAEAIKAKVETKVTKEGE